MHIAHLAIWANDLEKQKGFFSKYFEAVPSPKYINKQKETQSYFLTFASGAQLELMHRPDIHSPDTKTGAPFLGYAHLAISVGSEAAVDRLTERLVQDGYSQLDGPRRTGDGYYESVFLDPEGNRLEITV